MEQFSGFQRERTLGDGMDSALLKLTESNMNHQITKMNLHSVNRPVATFKPIEPNSKTFPLVPKYVPKERKQPKYLTWKPKEPKFVPYEPYKGAVEPMVPKKRRQIVAKPSKNNVEIQELVMQMSEIRMAELKQTPAEDSAKSQDIVITRHQWEKEKNAYATDIKNLRETNAHLENQLKFQAQVNSELKTLLVAAVGEDLESRVQHLTEDKLQLARALLNQANHLTSHQEQTEWLSGQCEVWRSKFLASSLMVEELARWKSALSTRINDLVETVKGLLQDRDKMHRSSSETYSNLGRTLEKLTQHQHSTLKNFNIVELASANCSLSQEVLKAVSPGTSDFSAASTQVSQLSQHTVWERTALKILQNPVTLSTKQDAICNALMGTAMSLTGEQMYLQHPSAQATCCSHCTGQIEDI